MHTRFTKIRLTATQPQPSAASIAKVGKLGHKVIANASQEAKANGAGVMFARATVKLNAHRDPISRSQTAHPVAQYYGPISFRYLSPRNRDSRRD
jgi:hypothetical protein